MWKDILTFNRAERRGTFLLGMVLAIVFAINLWFPYIFNERPVKTAADEKRLIRLAGAIQEQDEGEDEDEDEEEEDPSSLDRPGGRLRRIKESVSDTKYSGAAPEHKSKPASYSASKKPQHRRISGMIELNQVDSAALDALPGIGRVLSARIIRFREALGGYYGPEQLKEVYGVKPEWFQQYGRHFTADTSMIRKLKLLSAEFREILGHPYMDYEMTRAVFRLRREGLSGMRRGQVLTAIGCPDSLRHKLQPYL